MVIFQSEDCSPIRHRLCDIEHLAALAKSVSASDWVIPLYGQRKDDDPVISCEWDGTWWAGRYIGSVSHKNLRLDISPRFGFEILTEWLADMHNIKLHATQGQQEAHAFFFARLLAILWTASLIKAARHGLPALPRTITETGMSIKGQLAVPASLRHIAAGTRQVSSIRREKTFDHAVSHVIAAAFFVLQKSLGRHNMHWLPPRAQDLMRQILAITGNRPTLPGRKTLEAIRYSPITAGFRTVAEMSWRIANQQGQMTNRQSDGQTHGFLVDVAELWENYVISVLRQAAGDDYAIIHTTYDSTASRHLLSSADDRSKMGLLLPDAQVFTQNRIVGIVDAKYKSILPSHKHPNGVQREDLYQMTAYLNRFVGQQEGENWAMVAYPEWGESEYTKESEKPVYFAEQHSPWKLPSNQKIAFVTLPPTKDKAVEKMKSLLANLTGRSHR